jgi:hypothetical protein
MTKGRAGQGLFPLNGKELRSYSIKILYLKCNCGCRRIDLMGGEIKKVTRVTEVVDSP